MPDLPFEAWRRLIEAPKAIFGWPGWDTSPVYQETKQSAAKAGRTRFVSRETERCRLNVQVMDNSGATLEGVEVIILMWRHRPMEDMTALFNVSHGHKPICISRVDVRPASPHPNAFWRRFKCPSEIHGSHVHPFAQNMTLGNQAFDPKGNLPVALPLDQEPQHLKDFLRVAELAFNVDGLTTLLPPPTQGSLL